MKKVILIFLAIVIFDVPAISQDINFEKFISYFPDKELPYIINNFSNNSGNNIPDSFALKYLCGGDSSLLTFENVGINQETREVVYRHIEPYQYKAYVKYKNENYHLLIYDGYVQDGFHEFTTVINIGLFSDDGLLLDEMPFYIFDDTGKLEEQTAQIHTDYKIEVIQKKYIKNEKGKFTNSYNKIITTYAIDKKTGKFKEISKNKIFVNNSNK